ncbi:MAG: T9SS type A sorting domain-containing protein [Bacteroidia bacterium]|nr:T9SS type A sorting domain-containing protein [Bacteroidia bacterium]
MKSLTLKIVSALFVFILMPAIALSQTYEKDFLQAATISEDQPVVSNIDDGTDRMLVRNSEKAAVAGTAQKVLAPPLNDAYVWGLNPPYVLSPNAGPCVYGTLDQATFQAGEVYGSCQTTASIMSVWYSFMATQTNMWVSLLVMNGSCYTAFTVYLAGPTIPGLANQVGCTNYPNSNPSRPQAYKKVNLTGLTIGATYAIQVTYPNNILCGTTGIDFCIAVGTPSNCSTCASPCGPACTFPTGPPSIPLITSTCPPSSLSPPMNENNTRTRCHTFTANYNSMTLQMIIQGYYCNPLGGNVYSFNWSLYNSTCGLPLQTGTLANLTLTGLTGGQNYVLCYNWMAACDMDTVWPYLYSNSPLPMELLSFEGKQVGNSVQVNWLTASEKNTDYFILEKTRNGEEFTEAGRIKAAGNSTQIHHYSLTDDSPAEGMNYYRLTEIDFDGTKHETHLITVSFKSDIRQLTLHPNPASSDDGLELLFYSENNKRTQIYIYDFSGRVVYSSVVFPSANSWVREPVKTTGLKKGVYCIRVNTDSSTLLEKLVFK